MKLNLSFNGNLSAEEVTAIVKNAIDEQLIREGVFKDTAHQRALVKVEPVVKRDYDESWFDGYIYSIVFEDAK